MTVALTRGRRYDGGMFTVKAKRGAAPVNQTFKTAKEAVAQGDLWAAEGASVKIETTDGLLMDLAQFKKTIIGGVRMGDA